MSALDQMHLWLRLSRSHGIARRYFVVNGFDGGLTMLGLLTGFWLGGEVKTDVVLSACLGAAVALGVSGSTSAFLSESAERRKALAELEEAMMRDLADSAHGDAARAMPWLIALVNGVAPLLISLLILSPLAAAQAGLGLPAEPLLVSIAMAFLCIFGLGVFLGQVGGTHWLASGMKAMLIALATVLIILLLEG